MYILQSVKSKSHWLVASPPFAVGLAWPIIYLSSCRFSLTLPPGLWPSIDGSFCWRMTCLWWRTSTIYSSAPGFAQVVWSFNGVLEKCLCCIDSVLELLCRIYSMLALLLFCIDRMLELFCAVSIRSVLELLLCMIGFRFARHACCVVFGHKTAQDGRVPVSFEKQNHERMQRLLPYRQHSSTER